MTKLVLALALATACIPFPHSEQRAPEILGSLQRHGEPVAGARVRLSVNAPGSGCGDDAEVAITDGSGRFRFARTADFAFFMWFGDRMDQWRVCFEVSPVTRAEWTAFGWWGGPLRQRIVCRFDAAPDPNGPANLVSLAADAPPPRDGCQVVTGPSAGE